VERAEYVILVSQARKRLAALLQVRRPQTAFKPLNDASGKLREYMSTYIFSKTMSVYYAATYFHQNDQEFRCTWDLTATKENPTDDETIRHLAAMLEENDPETWALDEDDEDDALPCRIDLFGLSPLEFAREIVLNEKSAAQRFGLTWTISTRWEEVDPDNWDHPCNS
jgi:hypothetical protein